MSAYLNFFALEKNFINTKKSLTRGGNSSDIIRHIQMIPDLNVSNFNWGII